MHACVSFVAVDWDLYDACILIAQRLQGNCLTPSCLSVTFERQLQKSLLKPLSCGLLVASAENKSKQAHQYLLLFTVLKQLPTSLLAGPAIAVVLASLQEDLQFVNAAASKVRPPEVNLSRFVLARKPSRLCSARSKVSSAQVYDVNIAVNVPAA